MAAAVLALVGAIFGSSGIPRRLRKYGNTRDRITTDPRVGECMALASGNCCGAGVGLLSPGRPGTSFRLADPSRAAAGAAQQKFGGEDDSDPQGPERPAAEDVGEPVRPEVDLGCPGQDRDSGRAGPEQRPDPWRPVCGQDDGEHAVAGDGPGRLDGWECRPAVMTDRQRGRRA